MNSNKYNKITCLEFISQKTQIEKLVIQKEGQNSNP